MVRAKFSCTFKDERNKTVYFAPVYTGSEENKRYWEATPGGQIAMYTVNEAALAHFEAGKEYYVDFTAAG